VYGHFTGSNPWAKCDNPCVPAMSLLVGAQIKEVAVMNQLSSNLHFMMVCVI
jgi:kynureninase